MRYLWVRSFLEPTMTHGTELMPQKFTILSYTIWTMSKDFLDVTEYTRTKPCIPMACLEFRMEYSSW